MANITEISADPATWPTGTDPADRQTLKLWNVCRAAARAEGADIIGSAPDRLNNPGDLSKGDEHGQAVLGYQRLPDGEIAIYFATKEGGWIALFRKFRNILLGQSHVYLPTWTWEQIAQGYAGDAKNWVANVTRELGVKSTDTFASYFEEEENPT